MKPPTLFPLLTALLLSHASAQHPAAPPAPAPTRALPSAGAVSPAARAAILAGLRWLARHQAPEGGWDSDAFNSACGRARPGRCDGPGYPEFDSGVTGLALLAFQSAGHGPSSVETHDGVDFGDVVRRGLDALVKRQTPDGTIGAGTQKVLYNHAVASLALAGACARPGGERWRPSARKAVDFLVAAQNPNRGWRYTPRSGDNDTSVTGWCVAALHAARAAGIAVPDSAFAGACGWIDDVTGDDHRVGYTAKNTGQVVVAGRNENYENHEALAALAIACRIWTGTAPDAPLIDDAARLLSADLPVWSRWKIDYYYWYHGTVALWLSHGPAGPRWRPWNAALHAALLPAQRPAADGCPAGSWDPTDRWGFEGGRVYATALNVMSLATPLRAATARGAAGAPREFTAEVRREIDAAVALLAEADEHILRAATGRLWDYGRVARPALDRAAREAGEPLASRVRPFLETFSAETRADGWFVRVALELTEDPLPPAALAGAAAAWDEHGIRDRRAVLEASGSIPWRAVQAAAPALAAAGIRRVEFAGKPDVGLDLAFAPPADADGNPLAPFGPDIVRAIADAIARLDHDRWDTREAASKDLEEMGAVALPELQAAALDAPAAERAARASAIIERIAARPFRSSHYAALPITLALRDGRPTAVTPEGKPLDPARDDASMPATPSDLAERGITRVLAVLDIDDEVPLEAVADIVGTLAASGAECCVKEGPPRQGE